jgi:hypothetical protein
MQESGQDMMVNGTVVMNFLLRTDWYHGQSLCHSLCGHDQLPDLAHALIQYSVEHTQFRSYTCYEDLAAKLE